MDRYAINVITTLGGSTEVARMLEAPISTVSSWREIGIPDSRLAHLKLAAKASRKSIDWETGLPPAAAAE